VNYSYTPYSRMSSDRTVLGAVERGLMDSMARTNHLNARDRKAVRKAAPERA
jgi:hypothetical protein